MRKRLSDRAIRHVRSGAIEEAGSVVFLKRSFFKPIKRWYKIKTMIEKRATFMKNIQGWVHKNILAAFFFFCLTVLGLKLAVWQYQRFLWKESLLTANTGLNNGLELPFQKAQAVLQPLLQSPPVVSLNPDPRMEQVYCPVLVETKSLHAQALLVVPTVRNVSLTLESYVSYCATAFDFPLDVEVMSVPMTRRPFIPPSVQRDKEALRVNQISDQSIYTLLLSLDTAPFVNEGLMAKRHLGYMLQWAVLSVISLGFSLYFLLKRKSGDFFVKPEKSSK